MPSKLGFQLHDAENVGQALTLFETARPAAIIGLENVAMMDAAYARLGAGVLYAFQRFGMADVHEFIARYRSLETAVADFIEMTEPQVTSLRWVYHLSFRANRITEASAAFDALLVQRVAERFGTRLVIGNFASGTPSPSDWALYRPALEAAVQYNAIIGLAERYPILPYVGYGPNNANIPNPNATTPRKLQNEIPYPQNYTGTGEIVGRYRYLRDYLRAESLPVRLLITQIGAGRILPNWMDQHGQQLGDWQTLQTIWRQFGFSSPERHYFQDLHWLDQHVYGADPEVLAACLFAMNTSEHPNAEVNKALFFLNALKHYIPNARQDQPLPYTYQEFEFPTEYEVLVPRVRIRPEPSTNNKYMGGFDFGETFRAIGYTMHEGFLWLRHQDGWTAYTTLDQDGNPEYDTKFLEGKLVTTPRQDAAVNNFVGTLEEVKQFMQAHKNSLFYIEINPDSPPDGARQFKITTFPSSEGRRIIDQMHPAEGDPLMTPGAKRQLWQAGQL